MIRPPLIGLLLLCAALPVQAGQITVYRCVDAAGHVSLQDEPCPPRQQQDARVMSRPVDAPPRQAPAIAKPIPEPPSPRAPPAPAHSAPPPMYVCTSYDGISRESEVYDPNPRCEPYILYHPKAAQLPPQWQTACRWVEDSCVRLSNAEACLRFKNKQREAKSAVLHAFSSDAAYRKSELARLTQIVDDSCR